MIQTKAQIAEQFANAFKQGQRADGETYHYFEDDDCPWADMADIHGTDIFPNDWRYEKMSHMALEFLDYEPDSWEENISEIVDNVIDVHDYKLLAWLSGYPGALQAADEQECGAVLSKVAMAQYEELYAIAYRIMHAICEEADAQEEDCA